jgi:hypothetical protein
MIPLRKWSTAIAVAVLTLGTALAHHSTAEFDYTKEVTIKGVVKEVQWTNPHSYIQMLVDGQPGEKIQWSVEIGSPTLNVNLGWRKDSVKPGDVVTMNLAPYAEWQTPRNTPCSDVCRWQAAQRCRSSGKRAGARTTTRRGKAVERQRIHAAEKFTQLAKADSNSPADLHRRDDGVHPGSGRRCDDARSGIPDGNLGSRCLAPATRYRGRIDTSTERRGGEGVCGTHAATGDRRHLL